MVSDARRLCVGSIIYRTPIWNNLELTCHISDPVSNKLTGVQGLWLDFMFPSDSSWLWTMAWNQKLGELTSLTSSFWAKTVHDLATQSFSDFLSCYFWPPLHFDFKRHMAHLLFKSHFGPRAFTLFCPTSTERKGYSPSQTGRNTQGTALVYR